MIADRQRIDGDEFVVAGDLHQAQLRAIGVFRNEFGVEGDRGRRPASRRQRAENSRGLVMICWLKLLRSPASAQAT